ncbi:MAG: histidine phosphatase family protein [Parvularculaceae bacterium]|nr:histidine phosphatase family protein [Parvularculaceae bacterium]
MQGSGRRRLYLMRHGHVDYFAPGLEDPRLAVLTDEGRRQAQAARDALRQIRFDLALSSGLRRTRETAEIVLAAHGPEVVLEEEPGFEELKSGFLKAQSREELAARLAFGFDDADRPGAKFLPDGETFAAAEARIVAALQKMLLGRAWRQALLVAHEGVNRIILGWACQGGLASIGAFEQDLGCINVVDIDVAPDAAGRRLEVLRAIIKSMNVTPYDYVKEGLARTSLEHLFGIDFGASRPARPA